MNLAPSNPVETEFNTDPKDDDQTSLTLEVSLISTRLSGPKEPTSDQSTSRLSPRQDKGNAKMPKYEDSDGTKSTHSRDSEYGDLDGPLTRIRVAPRRYT